MVIITAESSDAPFEKVAGSAGPMQVWDGDWWRLLINNLHHVGLIHLFLNLVALIYLGRIIERRMSAFLYLLLLAGSAFCVSAVTGLVGESGIGLSGIVFAQVGLLMVWRDRDESVADEFTLRAVLVFGFWLLFCQVITYADILHIGNVAHFTGLVYGWIWGQVYLEERQKGIFRFLFGVGHFLLFPAFWFILHPFWLGSWHWYQSQKLDLIHDEMKLALETATDRERPEIEQKIAGIDAERKSVRWQRRKVERLQTALLLEPSIEHGWVELSEIYEREGDRRLGLRVALEGLKHNRNSEKLLNRAVDLWVDDERFTRDSNVPNIVEQVFGAEADIWQEKLSARVVTVQNRLAWQPEELSQLMGLPQLFSPSRFVNRLSGPRNDSAEDPREDPGADSPPKVPEFDPSQPDSAIEGILF